LDIALFADYFIFTILGGMNSIASFFNWAYKYFILDPFRLPPDDEDDFSDDSDMPDRMIW
jgi:hypothetical protein